MHYTSRTVYEYVSQQTNDPIIQWKICTVSGTEFPITQSDLDFYNKISPTFGDQKFAIPTPTLCPEERQRRRLSFRNERKLYKRKCDLTSKDIVSIYNPDKPYKVYDQSVRRWDSRDPMDYGRDFDFSKSFTEQFGDLMKEVPKSNNANTKCEKSEYIMSSNMTNSSYMSSLIATSENILYSHCLARCNNLSDSEYSVYCDFWYWLINCTKCNNCFYCINCEDSSSLMWCTDCISCEFCINCVNLIHKKYYINNISYTKEEYMKKTVWYDYNLWNIYKNQYNINTKSCFWNRINSWSESVFCYNIGISADSCKYINISWKITRSYDVYRAYWGLELWYESIYLWWYKNIYWCDCIWWKNNIYIIDCNDCSDCFWCIWLRNKSYCIFNKQYTKEEYEVQVATIISHMQATGERWEFFHPSLSPFGYNETVAQEYFPLVKGELESVWYHRSDYSSDPVIPVGAVLIHRREYDDTQWKALRDDPQHSILKSIVICEVSGRPFVIQWAELKFYLQHDIALPSKHPDVRHEERMKLRPGRTLFLRSCDQCSSEMLSVYDHHVGRVYCESCYQKKIYG